MTFIILFSFVGSVSASGGGDSSAFTPFSTPVLVGSQSGLEAALLLSDVHITLTGDFDITSPVSVPDGTVATIDGGYTISVISGVGLIVQSGGELTLADVTIQGNPTPTPGDSTGLVIEFGGEATITDGTLISGFNNSGVQTQGGSFIMKGGEVSGNRAWSGGGVNISVGGGAAGSFTMNGGTISSNVAYRGGGVSVTGNFIMRGGTIKDNRGQGDGGGVALNGGTFTMYDGEISGNTAGTGGGVHTWSASAFTM